MVRWCDVFGSSFQQFLSRCLPFLYCPPHAQPHATVYSLLQVVAAQLFRHPFRSGNREWQKELAPSFHITKKKNGGGGACLVLAQLTLRFRKTAHCHPRNNRLGEGEGNRQLPPVWKSSAIFATSHWSSTSRVREWDTKPLASLLLRSAQQRDTSPV